MDGSRPRLRTRPPQPAPTRETTFTDLAVAGRDDAFGSHAERATEYGPHPGRRSAGFTNSSRERADVSLRVGRRRRCEGGWSRTFYLIVSRLRASARLRLNGLLFEGGRLQLHRNFTAHKLAGISRLNARRPRRARHE